MRLVPALCLVAVCSATVQAQSDPPRRIVDGQTGAVRTWAQMIDELALADVVFVGENHDDPNTHLLELAILQELSTRGRPITLAMEMFERDVQPTFDKFHSGSLAEPDFLKFTRPWPRYATDYKPMVDFAVGRRVPVVGSNVPRPFASDVSKSGWTALGGKPEAQQSWFSHDLQCATGDDEYYRRFLDAMGTHPDASADRFYFAQCLKDETMGESIARAYAAMATPSGARPLVMHVNGAFHSDFHFGTVSRAQRRLPGKRIAVVTVLPVADIEAATPDAAERRRGDFLLYTPAPRKG